MTKVIGVRFRQAGKIYFFAPGKYEDIETGQHVIVETARGVEYGHVVLGIREVEDKKVIQPLKAVIRIATPEDDEREARNRRKEKEAFQICLEKIAKHKLEMKLIKVEYTFDNNKVLFYFTAGARPRRSTSSPACTRLPTGRCCSTGKRWCFILRRTDELISGNW